VVTFLSRQKQGGFRGKFWRENPHYLAKPQEQRSSSRRKENKFLKNGYISGVFQGWAEIGEIGEGRREMLLKKWLHSVCGKEICAKKWQDFLKSGYI
jgi:hypothetical protein